MSYEPTNWKDGDLVTSAKLNKLEQGVANSNRDMVMMTVEENDNTGIFTVNKTWQEIWDNNYTMVYMNDNSVGKTFFQIAHIDPSDFGIYVTNYNFQNWLTANSANEYPILSITLSPPAE